MDHQPTEPDLETVRNLLSAAFTAKDLRRFCLERSVFRPVVDRFGLDAGLGDMVDEVIDFCRVRLLWPELLDAVRTENPRQYARFAADLPAVDEVAGQVSGQQMTSKPGPGEETAEDEGLREAEALLRLAFVRWQRDPEKLPPILPPWEEVKLITAYADWLADCRDDGYLAFMLLAALWYGQDTIYWAQRNKDNERAVEILLRLLQAPYGRPRYRVGLVLEFLTRSLRSKIIAAARAQPVRDEDLALILNAAESANTLSFWERDLSKTYDRKRVAALIREAKLSRRLFVSRPDLGPGSSF
jgi:hypothetical protein